MKKLSIFILFLLLQIPILSQINQDKITYRPPAIPLVTHDPYFSIWSFSNKLTESETVHWTGVEMPLHSLIKIDGKVFRLIGQLPAFVPAAEQIDLKVWATRSIYKFKQSGVEIELTFLSPLIAEEIDLASRPVTYVNWNYKSLDGKNHKIELYFDVSGAVAVDKRNEKVEFGKTETDNLNLLTISNQKQEVLNKSGDDVRINWGSFYLGVPKSYPSKTLCSTKKAALLAFVNGESITEAKLSDSPFQVNRAHPATAAVIPTNVSGKKTESVHILLAYDDVYSIELFKEKLLPYWMKQNKDISSLLKKAEDEYKTIASKCAKYDVQLEEKAAKAGGKSYAEICNLAYRQCMSAHKIVLGKDEQVLCFSKENFSNGSIGTVDVFYPASPIFLYLNPELIKAQTTPIFEYAKMKRWPWPYAPHDIGTYPLANGQTYGGGEKTEEAQMPVEESGNMIILASAIARVEGNANYALKYWDLISKWAKYLKEKGYDPENQLCSDDFAGHLAHNTNLSIKAIVALAGYSQLCKTLNKNEEAAEYLALAKSMAAKWVIEANDGDHYKLAFDKTGTWSMKYNLLWDQLLDLNLFPEEVYKKELSYYLKIQNVYGLPLDNRESYAKLDWIVWTASLANDTQTFTKLINPIYNFLMQTPNRVPMTDWYWTKTGEMTGFRARSVVGGVFSKLLKDKLDRK